MEWTGMTDQGKDTGDTLADLKLPLIRATSPVDELAGTGAILSAVGWALVDRC